MLSETDKFEIKVMIAESIIAERKRLAKKLREFVDNQIANSASADPAENVEMLARFIESEDK